MENQHYWALEQQSHSEITQDLFIKLLGVDRKHILPHDSNKTFEEIKDYLVHVKSEK